MLNRPDGDELAFANAIQSQRQLAVETIHDPYPTSARQRELLAGDELAFANAIVAAADSLHDPLTAEEQGSINPEATTARFVPGVTDFPRGQEPAPLNRVERAVEQGPQVIPYLSQGMTADDVVGVRPDDRADRFAHSDVASQPRSSATARRSNGSRR